MSSNLTKQEKDIYTKLKNKRADSIREWLEDIKKGTDAQHRVINLLSGSKIYTDKDTGIYPIIIKWCILNIKGYDFTGVPNYKKILSMIDASGSGSDTSGSGASDTGAAGAASSVSSDIISVLKKWREFPTLDPNTGTVLPASIREGTAYDELYKDCISKLIKHIFKNKKGSNADTLTIQDCKYIKESMPNIHAIAVIKDANNNVVDTIFYDHLFVKYFLRLKGTGKHINDNIYKYDYKYMEELEPYLYLIVYDTLEENMKRHPNSIPNGFYNTEQLLKSKYIYFGDSDYALGYFVQNLCDDIKNVLYMHESKITTVNINRAIYNKEVLKYMLSVYKLSMNNTEIVEEIVQLCEDLYYDKNNYTAQYTIKYEINAINRNRKHPQNNIYYIYTQIVYHIAKDANVCKTLIAIYDDILKLYSDSNMKNTIYKMVKDPYNTNKGVEPQIPRRAQLPIDLQRYKMLSSAPSAPKNPESERLLKEYEDKWKAQLKEYEKKKDIYDRIYEGKVSPRRKNKHNHKHYKSVSPPTAPPTASFVKYDKKYKAFTTSPLNRRTHHSDAAEAYYVNDSDPYTQEPFADMHPNKRKHLSDITYIAENGKVFHYRFDTVSIYNYLLECITNCVKPINFYHKTEMTNDNLDEICSKIKYFTKKPTYNSSLDIRAILDNCYYNNKLVFDYKTSYLPYRTDNPIIGYFKIYLNLKLGGVLFKVINKLPPDVLESDNFPNQTNIINAEVAVLPLFAEYIRDIYFDDITYDFPEYIMMDMQTKLAKGGFLMDKYYPNRKSNKDGERWKKVVQIPSFDLDVNDDGDVAFDKLKKYREKLLII